MTTAVRCFDMRMTSEEGSPIGEGCRNGSAVTLSIGLEGAPTNLSTRLLTTGRNLVACPCRHLSKEYRHHGEARPHTLLHASSLHHRLQILLAGRHQRRPRRSVRSLPQHHR